MISQVIMYQPICRDLLEDLFQSAAVAQSFRDIGSGAYSIELPERDVKRLKRFNVAYASIRKTDASEVNRKLLKFAA